MWLRLEGLVYAQSLTGRVHVPTQGKTKKKTHKQNRDLSLSRAFSFTHTHSAAGLHGVEGGGEEIEAFRLLGQLTLLTFLDVSVVSHVSCETSHDSYICVT